jgi:hypothetical protein
MHCSASTHIQRTHILREYILPAAHPAVAPVASISFMFKYEAFERAMYMLPHVGNRLGTHMEHISNRRGV